MRKLKFFISLLIILVIGFAYSASSQTGTFQNFGHITVVLDTAGVPEQVNLTRLMTVQFEMFVTDNSTGPVYIGDSTVDNTWLPRVAGSTTFFTAAGGNDIISGRAYDLSQVYLVGSSDNDTVIIQYGRKQ